MSDQNNDFGTFFAGLIVGGLVGAAVALLMAPQTGEETRTVIRDKGIELKDRAVEYSADAIGKADQAYEDARTRAAAALDDLKMRADDLSKAAMEKASELQEKLPKRSDLPKIDAE